MAPANKAEGTAAVAVPAVASVAPANGATAPVPVHEIGPQRAEAVAPPPGRKETEAASPPRPAARVGTAPAGKDNAKPAKGLSPSAQKANPLASAVSWPANWREALAGEDRALLKRLERFEGPHGVLDWALNAERRLTTRQAGAMRPAADATPDEVWAWRAAVGIPDAPDQYVLTLRNGRTLGDDDRPVFDSFARAAHEAGLSNAQLSRAMDWYFDLVEKETADILDEDETVLEASVRALEGEWGAAGYRRAVAAIRQLFAGAPGDLEAMILGARMENGRKIGGDAGALRFLAKLSREVHPPSTFIPDGDQSGRGIDAEIADIERVMQADNARYWRDPKMQERYGELLATRDGSKRR